MSDFYFRLVVNKVEPNENYDPKAADRYGPYDPMIAHPTIEQEALRVMVTEKQFEAIRKAVLEAF